MKLTTGILGWGNRKGGLEAYGPGGRWAQGRNGQKETGDLLGDHLTELGVGEGAHLIVIVIDRQDVAVARGVGTEPEQFASVEQIVRDELGLELDEEPDP